MGMSWPYLAVFTAGAFIAHLVSREVQARYLVTAGAVYVVSLVVHPYRACWACHGTARHVGAVYAYAYRPCTRCHGSGKGLRLGAWLMGRR